MHQKFYIVVSLNTGFLVTLKFRDMISTPPQLDSEVKITEENIGYQLTSHETIIQIKIKGFSTINNT